MSDDSHDDGKEKEFEKIDKIIENIPKFISFATGIIYANIPAFSTSNILSAAVLPFPLVNFTYHFQHN